MSVYASVPAYAQTRRHPNALLLIAGAHVVLLAVVMSAKMAVPILPRDGPIIVRPIPIPPDPPENLDPPKPRHQPAAQPHDSRLDQTKPIVTIPNDDGPTVDPTPIPRPDPGPVIGTNPDPVPIPKPIPAVVRTGPRFMTPRNLIEPPYPEDKRRLEEETSLRLKLSIDERGRVVAVDPIGSADPSFLNAARRHLIAYWRYKPAMEGDHAIASSTVITLTFRLE